nr:hypothetical protein HK105_001369 [Polyrhizophydium stewartii]
MPDWRDDQNKRAAVAIAACSAGDAALALDAVRGLPAAMRLKGSVVPNSMFVAATAQRHETLAVKLLDAVGKQPWISGIIVSNSLTMMDAARKRFPSAELNLDSILLAIRLHRNELVPRLFDWFDYAISPMTYYQRILSEEAAKAANGYVLALLLSRYPAQAAGALIIAAKLGYLTMLQDIYNTLPDAPWPANVLAAAAEGKQRDLVAWLVRGPLALRSAKAMEHAARHGDLAMVEILHHDGAGLADTLPMDAAAAAGHLHIAVWLRTYRKEGCTNRAICEAAQRNNLAMVKFLYHQCRRRCDKATLCFCIRANRLEVVEFLLERKTPFNPSHIDFAVRNNMLDMVKFLYRFRPGYDWRKMRINACATEMIEWLTPRATPTRRTVRRNARKERLAERRATQQLEQLQLDSRAEE